jgi:hypothetical protein
MPERESGAISFFIYVAAAAANVGIQLTTSGLEAPRPGQSSAR